MDYVSCGADLHHKVTVILPQPNWPTRDFWFMSHLTKLVRNDSDSKIKRLVNLVYVLSYVSWLKYMIWTLKYCSSFRAFWSASSVRAATTNIGNSCVPDWAPFKSDPFSCECEETLRALLTSWRHQRHRPFKVPCGMLSCERVRDWFSTESMCATSQSLGNTLDLFGVRRNSEGTLNILEAPEASTLQSALWDAFMRESQRLVFDGIYVRHLAAARKYARSLWSAKKLRRHS